MGVFLLLTLLSSASSAWSEAEGNDDLAPQAQRAVTASDPELSTNELKLRLVPIAKSELAGEVAAWFENLKSKVIEISEVEISILHKNLEIEEISSLNQSVDQLVENSTTGTQGNLGLVIDDFTGDLSTEQLFEINRFVKHLSQPLVSSTESTTPTATGGDLPLSSRQG